MGCRSCIRLQGPFKDESASASASASDNLASKGNVACSVQNVSLQTQFGTSVSPSDQARSVAAKMLNWFGLSVQRQHHRSTNESVPSVLVLVSVSAAEHCALKSQLHSSLIIPQHGHLMHPVRYGLTRSNPKSSRKLPSQLQP